MVFRWHNIFLFLSLTMHASWMPRPIISSDYKPGISYWSSLSSADGFTLVLPNQERKKIKDSHLFIHTGLRTTWINGTKMPIGRSLIIPHAPTNTMNGIQYRGPLTVRVQPQSMQVWAVPDTKSSVQSLVQPLAQIELPETVSSQEYYVRVLLHEMKPHNSQSWLLGSDHGFILFDPTSKKSKKITQEELKISYKKNSWHINKSTYNRDCIHLIPREGFASVNGVPYHGSFLLVRDSKRLMLINNVELEEYVYCVLRTESWPGWPLEVNKVFAIASRSYVMAQIKQARKKKLPYHVKNTNDHQTYKGMHHCLTSRAAVDQTRGVFLAYENKPVLAMFDCCCGGITPAHIEDFDFSSAPYLKREYPCKHCKKCKLYSWHAEFERDSFYDYIKRYFNDLGTIKEVKISRKDKAGLVKDVDIATYQEVATMTGQQFYKLFKEVKSFYFNMQKKSDKVVIKGRGYGHHLGLCQWGAREMVRDGWNYKRILEFYYPGTQFLRLTT